MVADGADRDNLQAVLIVLVRIQRDVIGDDDHLRLAGAIGIQAQRTGAACHDQADVGIFEFVAGQRFVDGARHFGLRHGDLQPDRFGGVPQPFQMLWHPEYDAVVAAHAFEDAISVEQTVIVDADARVFFGVIPTADVDLECHAVRYT